MLSSIQKKPLLGNTLLGLAWMAAAAGILWLGYDTWRGGGGVSLSSPVRSAVLICDGFGAAFCLAGAINVLDKPRQNAETRRLILYGLELARRLLFVGQVACVAVALYGAVHLYFGPSIRQPWAQTAPATAPKPGGGHV